MNKQFTLKKAFFQINIQDIRGKKKACEICQKDFSVLQKEHQCKRCKRAVCYSCSQNKEIIYKIGLYKSASNVDQKPHRQCDLCHEESQRMRQFIQSNSLAFGKDTLCERWLKQMNNKKNYEEIVKDYYDNLNDPQFEYKFMNQDASESMAFTKYKNAMSNMYSKLVDYCEAYNYSFQEFYHHITQKKDATSIQNAICNIIKAFLNKHPKFGFDDEFILVVQFFLSFASEPLAFMCLSYFYELVYPRELYYTFLKSNDYDIKKYSKLILSLLDSVFHLQSSDVQKIQSYLKHDFQKLALTLSINSLTFENTFLLIDNCIKVGNFLEFSKGLTAICSLRIEEIKKYADVSYEKLAVKILRNVEFRELQESLKMFEIVDQKIQDKIIKSFIQEEQKANFILDDKYLQNKILSSDQYKELQYKYEILDNEKNGLKKQIEEQNKIYQLTLAENQQQNQQISQLKNDMSKIKSELFDLQNLPQNVQTNQSYTGGSDQSKFIALLQAQIQELRAKYQGLEEELQITQTQVYNKNVEIRKLQSNVRENSKTLTDLAFENHNLQYELESNLGRSRTSTRSRTQNEDKLSYEMMEEKLKRTEKSLESLQETYDELKLTTGEQELELVRSKRFQQEAQFTISTLQLQITSLEQQLQDERQINQKNVEINRERLEMQYKKMNESLEIVYGRNDKLMTENEQLKKDLKDSQDLCQEQKQLIKLLQEEYEKQKYLNEEQEKISQEFKNRDLERQFDAFEALKENEDKEKEQLAIQLFKKIEDLIKEIQFRSIDQLLKREQLNKLFRESAQHEKAMRLLLDKVENYTDKKLMHHHSASSQQQSLRLEASIKGQDGQNDKERSINISDNKKQEDCNIM
ncbi:unnamed protein product (macronuclear) [Paramecium tetraurelia]|uniref:FYVE-type domain-containing protein n=1 Tax=Paramecium tetraurelia TaxID=5888 RepID=A0D7Q8_PARTE|nr:uncharacterized protein GSPATT00014042001 [Paramecium tetraurelia]CAK79075.1 unnamed protein product [Paramecium tetraurelia]|eukprot:XP_001446472.1 hypothetical protein (macronuclear) [Paramecium tetraurelia strain d4-2]